MTCKDLTAYQMGVAAFKACKDESDCPFNNDPYKRDMWIEGYYDAERHLKDMMNDE